MSILRPVRCVVGDVVRVVGGIDLTVDQQTYTVVKTGRSVVVLEDASGSKTEWHKSRVVEVVKEMSRPPKKRAKKIHDNLDESFDLTAYVDSFGSGAEHWAREKAIVANIIIEPDHKSFWYFRTEKDGRPKGHKYLGGRIGRQFPLESYSQKIQSLILSGYTKKRAV